MNDKAVVNFRYEDSSLDTKESFLSVFLFSDTIYPLVTDGSVYGHIIIDFIQEKSL